MSDGESIAVVGALATIFIAAGVLVAFFWRQG